MKKVYLVGIGMGNPDTLTLGAQRAVEESQLVIGARRLVDAFPQFEGERLIMIKSSDIAQAIHESTASTISVLLSGDQGFYSGAAGLYDLLADYNVEALPGISSPVYFCAKLKKPWQNAHLVSVHGRSCNVVGAVQSHAVTFALTGGNAKVHEICQELCERGLGHVRVYAGERLSYPDERIVSGTASELAQQEFLDLAVMLVENDAPLRRRYNAPSFADNDFQRGGAPMTKEEVRELSVCKLHLEPQHTVWDVGAGTGSVSLEMAFAVTEGQVIAIERNQPALELMAQNKERMGACNLRIVAGKAPEALEPLPAPDRVFIGGSGGNLTRIMQVALEKNPQVRFVVTAITLETIGTALQGFKELGLTNVEIVQANISRDRKAGPYHLMTAENPVYIMSAEGSGAGADAAHGADACDAAATDAAANADAAAAAPTAAAADEGASAAC